jgi:hypothetical protein
MQMLLSLNRSDAAISQCYDLDLQTFDVTVKLKVGGYSQSGKADQFPD